MSDTVKLIIKISEDVYTRLFDNGIQDSEIAVDDICEMARALRMGTPLDEVKLKIEQDMSWDMFDDYGNETAIHRELWEILDNIGKESEE